VDVISKDLGLGLAKRTPLPQQGKNLDREASPVQLNEIAYSKILVPHWKTAKNHG
jgi:hypothetical protein